jgi:benzoylformate decarboxylase/acetolactate synthase-1/2/3 large subunit
VQSLVELAETGSIPVVDLGGALNFPNTHPLDASGTNLVDQADLILLLDVSQPEVQLISRSRYPRGHGQSRVKAGAKVVSVGLTDMLIRSMTTDFGSLVPLDLNVAADTSLAIPVLTAELRALTSRDGAGRDRRAELVRQAREATRKRWEEEAEHEYGLNPTSHALLAREVWQAIKGDKWVVIGNAEGWTRRLWQMDRPGCVVGTGNGAAGLGTGLSRAVGVGLAARDEGGYCVAFNGDGDFFYDPSCLWTAVHHKIPLLAIVLDNGGYIGEGGHVAYTSRQRERPTDKNNIAVEIQNPKVDAAGYARAQGAYAEAVATPGELAPALQRAMKVVREEKSCALLAVEVAGNADMAAFLASSGQASPAR